jgi:hypothetical protein
VKERRLEGKLNSPAKHHNVRARIDKYSNFELEAIRRKVHQYFFKNEIPTLKKIRDDINNDAELPNLTLSTLRRLMYDIGFVFAKRNRAVTLLDREHIIQWCRKYLRTIRSYRDAGRKIYYEDETWVNAGHTVSKVWQDKTVKSSKQAFLEGLSTG